MSSIQGLPGVHASVTASQASPKAPVSAPAQATQPEFGETAQAERNETIRGTREVGESQPAQGGSATLGTKLSVTA